MLVAMGVFIGGCSTVVSPEPKYILVMPVRKNIPPCFSLTDKALMALDVTADSPGEAIVVEKNDIDGPGVEFTIYFPGNESSLTSLTLTSSSNRGKRRLSGLDISGFDAMELEFTLLSVTNSRNEPYSPGPLFVGAYLNDAYHPEQVDMKEGRRSVISTTRRSVSKEIEIICNAGFTIYIPAHWFKNKPNPWDPASTTVCLLVGPPGHTPYVPANLP
jgi:hypothetical protein